MWAHESKKKAMITCYSCRVTLSAWATCRYHLTWTETTQITQKWRSTSLVSNQQRFCSTQKCFSLFVFVVLPDFLVKPLFVALKRFSPGLSYFLETLNRNRDRWTNPVTGEPQVPGPRPSYPPIPAPASATPATPPPQSPPITRAKRMTIKSPLPLPSTERSTLLTPHTLNTARLEVKANVLDLTVSFKRDIDETTPNTGRTSFRTPSPNPPPSAGGGGRTRSNTLF